MRAARSVLLAVLVVAASVVGSVGVMGQTATDTGPVQYEYTGSPETLVVDTSALDGGTEFTVEYTTQGGPSTGTTVLARETYNTANLYGDELWFYNGGAYESVNVTVSGYSGGEPAFETRGIATSLNLQKTVVGSTGGDSDLTCDLSEKLGTMTGGYEYLDCTAQPGSTAVNTTGTDASQTKLDIYQSAQNSNAQADNYHNTLDNYLSDTKTQARIIGKNAYIKALNNGSSKSAAKTEAKDAVQDYYLTKQKNLVSEWDASLSNAEYLFNTANSESGIEMDGSTGDFVYVPPEDPDGALPGDTMYGSVDSFGSTSVTLLDGSTMSAKTVSGTMTWYVASDTVFSATYTASPTTGAVTTDPGGNGNADETMDARRIQIRGYDSNASPTDAVEFQRYADKMSAIETQNTQVRNDMDTLAENTYSAYQQGEINNSDLVDPYVLASQQSAGSDFQGWTAAQLTLLGTNSPENFDQIGSFNVTTGSGEQYEGVLFSQENPTSGQFENGTTYDTANISGTQYVVTSERIVELDGTFTIDRIQTQDGQNVQNVTIQKTTYKTTNVSELKQQYEDLAYKRAQIEAREQALAGGGGGLNLGSASPVVLVGIAAAAVLLLKD